MSRHQPQHIRKTIEIPKHVLLNVAIDCQKTYHISLGTPAYRPRNLERCARPVRARNRPIANEIWLGFKALHELIEPRDNVVADDGYGSPPAGFRANRGAQREHHALDARDDCRDLVVVARRARHSERRIEFVDASGGLDAKITF